MSDPNEEFTRQSKIEDEILQMPITNAILNTEQNQNANFLEEIQSTHCDNYNQTTFSNDVPKMKTEELLALNNNKVDKQIETLNNSVIDITKSEFVCSLYVTPYFAFNRSGEEKRESFSKQDLEKAILSINPSGNFKISETNRGIIASFAQEIDANNLLSNVNLAEALHGPVQVARFSRKNRRYKQIATLRDVPWSIPTQDICTALTYQGIAFENVDRFKNNIRVEILDANHYEDLIVNGLNFFDATRFVAVPDKWYQRSGRSALTLDMNGERINTSSPLQCFRCQGFWHVAANCRHAPRCVRCGESHSVEFCPRPRNNPICCHCSGSHHAAYKECPIRIELMNSIPISMCLSTKPKSSQSREIRAQYRL